MLERAGATGATVVELAISQHVAAVAAGQLDACYTLEPTGTVGRLNGTTRVLEAGVIATCWAIRWRPGSAARPR